jgi:hypothetical protein
MAKQRVVNTRFWNDPWVMEELNPLDRLLFLYFLTNDQTNLSGIYEISSRVICFETGIEKETLTKSMMPRLEPKVFYVDGWIIIPNFAKHQNTENPKIMAGIQRELALVPDRIYEKAIAYGYPIHRESHLTKLNLTKLNREGSNKSLPSKVPPHAVKTITTVLEREKEEIPSFRDWLEEQGYKYDSIVDDSGVTHVRWLDRYDVPVKKYVLSAFEKEYRTAYPPPSRAVPKEVDETDKFVEGYQMAVERRFGQKPIVGRETRQKVKANLVKKYPKDFLVDYTAWFLDNEKIDRKWKFSLASISSETFINQYLSSK